MGRSPFRRWEHSIEARPRVVTGVLLRVPLVVVLAVLPAVGCDAAKLLRRARMAEQAHEYHRAYDLYVAAAKKRSSGRTANGIRRTSRWAASHWAQRGQAAHTARDYERAWQCYMRSLTIRPDYRTAVDRIRALERDHPAAISRARIGYLEEGSATLAAAGEPIRGKRLAQDGDGRRLAQAEPPDELEATPSDTSTGPVATVSTNSDLAGTSTEATTPRAEPARPPGSPRRDEYLFIGVISRRDRRFPKALQAVDGIAVKIKDTDIEPELDADIEIYVNRRRVSKQRDMRRGQSVRIRGKSGRSYEMVILAIVHSTRTVRFGIRPAG